MDANSGGRQTGLIETCRLLHLTLECSPDQANAWPLPLWRRTLRGDLEVDN